MTIRSLLRYTIWSVRALRWRLLLGLDKRVCRSLQFSDRGSGKRRSIRCSARSRARCISWRGCETGVHCEIKGVEIAGSVNASEVGDSRVKMAFEEDKVCPLAGRERCRHDKLLITTQIGEDFLVSRRSIILLPFDTKR